jgi:hypothetical protein
MRTARPPALVAFVLAAALLLAAPAGASGSGRRAPRLATEVCEAMVREAVEAVVGKPLAAPPVGMWVVPDKEYRCTYQVGSGILVMDVSVKHAIKGAKKAYRQALAAADVDEKLHGIGQQAFQDVQGAIVARKDNFVLSVEPRGIPMPTSPRDVAFAAAVAVMSCWPG